MNLSSIVGQLKAERDRLDQAIQALTGVNGNSRKAGKRTFSATHRAKLAKAQRARWRRQKAAQK